MHENEGRGKRPGVPDSQSKTGHTEQAQNRGGIKSPERQPLPSAWDVLEREARASDEFCSGRMAEEEYGREADEVNRLRKEIEKKGTARDKHILALLFDRAPGLSLLSEREQIQEWRSLVEPLSDDDIAERAR